VLVLAGRFSTPSDQSTETGFCDARRAAPRRAAAHRACLRAGRGGRGPPNCAPPRDSLADAAKVCDAFFSLNGKPNGAGSQLSTAEPRSELSQRNEQTEATTRLLTITGSCAWRTCLEHQTYARDAMNARAPDKDSRLRARAYQDRHARAWRVRARRRASARSRRKATITGDLVSPMHFWKCARRREPAQRGDVTARVGVVTARAGTANADTRPANASRGRRRSSATQGRRCISGSARAGVSRRSVAL